MINEEDAVEMINFMRKGTRKVVFGFDTNFGTINKLGFYAKFGIARNKTVDKRHR